MFKLKTEKFGEVEVWFAHRNPANHDLYPGTICFIDRLLRNGEKKRLSFGLSILNELDYNSYCKETGRKISLTRALDKLLGESRTKRQKTLSRKTRAQFWNAYFFTQELARQKAKENNK